MNPPAVELNQEHFDKIGEYVRSHFHKWLLEDREMNGDAVSGQLNRVESALEAAIALTRERFVVMDKRFEAMEARFDAVDKRFESMDKRFESMDKRFDEQMALTREYFQIMDKRFDGQMAMTRERFEAVDKRFDIEAKHAETRFELLTKRMNRQFSVMAGLLTVVSTAVVGMIVQGFFV